MLGPQSLSRSPLWAAGVCALLCCASTASSHAQEVDKHARSNALFDVGKRLLSEGRVAAACESFAESQRLEPRGGTLLNLGLCHEQQGLLLAARRELMDTLAIARRDARTDRVPIATDHIASIESRLAWLTLSAALGATRQSTLRIDSQVIDLDAGGAVPVEAGAHIVSLEAPGFERIEVNVEASPGERRSVQFGPLRPSVRPAPERGPVRAPPLAVEAAPAASPYATARLTALIVGAVGIAAGVVTGAIAWREKAALADHCVHQQCDSRGLNAAATGRAMTTASDVAFIMGIAGFGVWVALPGGVFNPDRAGAASVHGVF